MRILYVLPQLPFPADRGGKVVIHNIIEYMRRGHDVGVAALTHHREDAAAAEEYRDRVRELWTWPCPPRVDPGVLIRGALSSRPVKAVRFWNPAMARKVAELCENDSYDLVHAQNYYAAQYVPAGLPLATVHYKENFEGLLLDRCAREHGNPATRLLLRSQSRKTVRYELAVARRFDRVYTITRTDLERIRAREANLPLEYVPASIDTELFRPAESSPGHGDMVFVGTLDYFPNVDGLCWFHREVLPRIRRTRPDARLVVVGHRPDPRLAQLRNDPAVRFTGWVESVVPEVQKASVYVVPLRIGGGVRLKILEAMALGKAIVTTGVGCEGIECEPGKDLLVADDSESFAEAVESLLTDPERQTELESSARRKAVERYSTAVVLPRLEASYNAVLNEKRGTRT